MLENKTFKKPLNRADLLRTIITASIIIPCLLTGTYLALNERLHHANTTYHTYLRYDYEELIASLRTRIDQIMSERTINEKKIQEIFLRQNEISQQREQINNLTQNTEFFKRSENIGQSLLISDQEKEYKTATLENSMRKKLELIEKKQIQTIKKFASQIYEKGRNVQRILFKIHPDFHKDNNFSNISHAFFSPGEIDISNQKPQNLNPAIKKLINFQKQALKLPIANPIHGKKISSGFGIRNDPILHELALHTGIDMNAPSGTPIQATAPGIVKTAGWSGGYGKMVEIDHENGFSTRFAHMNRIIVNPRQKIKRGEIIGETGNTGRSTGPHLHYEVLHHGNPTDPVPFINAGNNIAEAFSHFEIETSPREEDRVE